MKRKLVFALMVCLAAVSPCFGEGEKAAATDIENEVKALLAQHDKAFSEQNLTGIMEVFSSDADIVLMGTGPGECYKGKEGVSGAYTEFFKNFAPGTLTHNYYWLKAGSKDDAAWFMAMSQSAANAKEGKKEFGINSSGFLKKENGKWRFAAMHFSILFEGRAEEAKP
ncbi:MAG: nuclear transport factor 2 family protein [Desulfococcaceae bacterium]